MFPAEVDRLLTEAQPRSSCRHPRRKHLRRVPNDCFRTLREKPANKQSLFGLGQSISGIWT